MEIRTHQKIDPNLCGTPALLEEGHCITTMTPTSVMRGDESGLVHGGFIFGMADYAAMLAVNHPNVVLGSSECKFRMPVVAGDGLTADARVMEESGKKRVVKVSVNRGEDVVFLGTFVCFVPETHVVTGN